MKKIFLTVGAVLSFVLASAQTTPTTTPAPAGGQPVKTDVMEQNKKEMEPKADGVNSNTQQQPTPSAGQAPVVKTTTGEPVATDHAKSTPAINRAKDTTAVKKPRKAKKQ